MKRSRQPSFTVVVFNHDSLEGSWRRAFEPTLNGQSPAAILAARLAQLSGVQPRVILLADSPEATVDADARALGWRLLRRTAPWTWPGAIFSLLRSDYWVLFDLQHPFIDVPTCNKMLAAAGEALLHEVRDDIGKEVLPSRIIAGKPALRACFNYLRQGGRRTFQRCLWAVCPRGSRRELTVAAPALVKALRAGLLHGDLITAMGGNVLDLRSLRSGLESQQIDADRVLTLARQQVAQQIQTSSCAHLWNERLLLLEAALQSPVLEAYPRKLIVDITSRCNARCGFCNHPVVAQRTRDRFTLADFERMDWLRRVSTVGLSGRLGDPLIHHQCIDIVHYLRQTHPHLQLYLTTNAIALNEAACEGLVGTLDRIVVSLNAATAATWREVMGVKGFDKVRANLQRLAALKRSRGTSKPALELCMVINRATIDEMADFVTLAHELDASTVEFDHFTPGHMPGCEMDGDDSAYADPERFDAALALAAARARSYRLPFVAPPPLAAAATLFEGRRTRHTSERCLYPWTNLLLADNHDLLPKVEFCCTSFDPMLRYTPADLYGDAFLQLWNHPYLQRYRQTVNQKPSNPACSFCRNNDQQDPGNREASHLQGKINEWLGETPPVSPSPTVADSSIIHFTARQVPGATAPALDP